MINYTDPLLTLGSIPHVEHKDEDKLDFLLTLKQVWLPYRPQKLLMPRHDRTLGQYIQHMLRGLATICAQERLQLTDSQ